MAPRRELTIGVDLGTTMSAAGIFDRGRVQLLTSGGRSAIPSVVHFPTHGDPVVGAVAERRVAFAPGRAVTSSKRLLGCRLGDAIVRRHAALSPYTIAPATGGRLCLGLEDGSYTCEQITGLILGHLREAIEKRYAARAKHVVLSVPSAATAEHERALSRAARNARLKVVEMIPAPVAGALGLGLHLEKSQRRFLICDFGGGSFDVAVIACGFGRLDVLATSGDPNLGGDDFTDALVGALVAEELGQTLFDVIRHADRYRKLSARVEPLKHLLSSESSVHLRARDASFHGDELRDLDRVMTREWADSLWRPLAQRAVAVASGAIAHIDCVADELDGVVLLGRVSRTPIVRLCFRQRFGELTALNGANVETAVVRGAVLRSSQFVGVRARRATMRTIPPPRSEPEVPDVAEPNMATTARIVPIRI